MSKRKIFDEMMEGVRAMKSHREGKITLRTYNVEAAPLPKVDSKLIRDTRKRLHCSRAVFARKLRINERTLEKWEQGRAKPNPQAAALVLLVRKYPDTLDRLERVAVGSSPPRHVRETRRTRTSRLSQKAGQVNLGSTATKTVSKSGVHSR
jgi:putative transcriptional regulator